MKCPFCKDDGWYLDYDHNPDTGEPIPVQVICRNCDGTGRIEEIER